MKANRKLIHPRKVVWAMRDFMDEISNIGYECVRQRDDEDIEDFLKRATDEQGEKDFSRAKCRMEKDPCGFSVRDYCPGEDYFVIGYKLDDEEHEFQNHFRKMFPEAKGFADVTICLLHELGHLSSQQKFDGFDREETLRKIYEQVPPHLRNAYYFMMPDEMNATIWAINWLKNPENRKIAKRFEKKFFACFE